MNAGRTCAVQPGMAPFRVLPVLILLMAGAKPRGAQTLPPDTEPAREPERMQCVEDDERRVCGYRCLKDQGDMRCTATPQGACGSALGVVRCWDPPAIYLAYAGAAAPAARCVTNFGKVACGYHCAEHDGSVACASTPAGRCIGNYGKVLCFDPPLGLWVSLQGNIPQAACVDQFGLLACGYGCVAQYGQVRCAQTPQGTCTVKNQVIQCFDPPVPEVLLPLPAP